jgi:hypothetical protein
MKVTNDAESTLESSTSHENAFFCPLTHQGDSGQRIKARKNLYRLPIKLRAT